MRRFIKTTVPAEGYQEVRRVGDKYVAHLEPVDNGDGSVTCYECMTDSEPDLNALSADLAVWKEYIAARELATARKVKIDSLMAYDSSDAVNSFTLGGQQMWLTRDERTQIDESINAYEATGSTQMTKYFGGVAYTFTLALWKQMLNALIVYASEALNVTEAHKATIGALTTVQAVEDYDFKVNYPPKLAF